MSRYASVMDLPAGMREQASQQLRGHKPPRIQIVENAPAPAKPSKYRNTRVFLEGEWFDSKLEYDCFCELKLRKVAGEIAYTKRQVTFVLEGGVKYRADFECVLTPTYAARVGYCSEVWDAKGCDTRSSINKRRQVLARYGIEVKLWRKPGGQS